VATPTSFTKPTRKGPAAAQPRSRTRHLPRLAPPSVPFRKFDEEVLRTLRGLRPHPLPLALDPEAQPRGTPPGLDDQAADTAVRGGEGEDLKEAGGRRPPASFKTPPLPRLDSLLGTLTRAGRGVRGGGGGRPRPFGMLPGSGREAARRDHQPQLVCELVPRDARSVMRKPRFLRGTVLFSGQGAFSSPC